MTRVRISTWITKSRNFRNPKTIRKGIAVFFGTIEEGIEALFGSIEEGSEALSWSIEEQGIEDVSREEEKKEQVCFE